MPFFVLAMEASSGRTAMTRPRNISDSVELLVPDSSGAKLPIEAEQVCVCVMDILVFSLLPVRLGAYFARLSHSNMSLILFFCANFMI